MLIKGAQGVSCEMGVAWEGAAGAQSGMAVATQQPWAECGSSKGGGVCPVGGTYRQVAAF